MTITEFLLARIAEDEAVARRAEPGPWFIDTDGVSIYYVFHNGDTLDKDRLAESSGHDAIHIARHDPARVLAECAAKRAIIDEHPDGAAAYKNPDGSYMPLFHGYCETCEIGHDAAPWPCTTLRALAAVYAGHPDYRQEWKKL